MLTWPGPRKPSRRRSGESRIALIVGTMVMWLQNTEKFSIPSASARRMVSAVLGMVVSKPRAEEDHLSVGILAGERERIERRVHDPHVSALGLGLEQALLRARHPERIAEGREDDLRPLGQGHAVVDPAHRQDADRAARPVHQLDGIRQHLLDAVAEDRVGMPAAHLHDLQRPPPGDLDFARPAVRSRRSAPWPSRDRGTRRDTSCVRPQAAAPLAPRSSASSVCTRSQRMW